LQAWIAWGPACLQRFAGMFAFALYDAKLDELVLVRDRYGVKPLYWTEEAGAILFASEIKALLRHRRRNRIDRQSLAEWWLYRNVDALTPDTLIDGIVQVLPGHLARVSAGKIQVEPWYSVVDAVGESQYRRLAKLTPDGVIDEIERQLDAS